MQNIGVSLKNVLTSGTVAGIATAVTAALAGRRETGSYAAPLNATSHVVWGNQAAMRNRPSLKYTLTGFLINHASTIFWAAIYEKFFGTSSRRKMASTTDAIVRPLIGSAVVTAGAYLTDYYLVPDRLTPGFEKRLSGKSLASIYGALAVGLAAGALISRKI